MICLLNLQLGLSAEEARAQNLLMQLEHDQ